MITLGTPLMNRAARRLLVRAAPATLLTAGSAGTPENARAAKSPASAFAGRQGLTASASSSRSRRGRSMIVVGLGCLGGTAIDGRLGHRPRMTPRRGES